MDFLGFHKYTGSFTLTSLGMYPRVRGTLYQLYGVHQRPSARIARACFGLAFFGFAQTCAYLLLHLCKAQFRGNFMMKRSHS